MPLTTEGNSEGIVTGRLSCPLHHIFTPGGECQRCKHFGLYVIQCEPDKIGRTQDTMESQGYKLDRPVTAMLVFRKE